MAKNVKQKAVPGRKADKMSTLDISETIDQFTDISSNITGSARVPVQDPGAPTNTEAATVQAVVDKGLEPYNFEPGDPAIQQHLTDTSNPHNVTVGQINAEPADPAIQNHLADTNNPHGVTPGQIGAEPADSRLQQHLTDTNNPHGVTASQVDAEPADPAIQQHLTDTSNPHSVTPGQIGAVSNVGYYQFVPVDASSVPNGTIFIDQADNRIKIKGIDGAVKVLMVGPYTPYQVVYTDSNGYITGLEMATAAGNIIGVANDGLSLGSIAIEMDSRVIDFSVFAPSEPVVPISGVEGFRVPLTAIDGYEFVDIVVGCSSSSAGTVTVNVLKDGAQMMSVPISLTNQLYVDMKKDPNAVIKPNPENIVSRGQRITYEVGVSGGAPSGLDISIVLRALST